MTVELIALLDRPSPLAFSMVPFVIRDSDGALQVRGLHNRTRSALDTRELNDLVASGSALGLSEPAQVDVNDDDVVAGWVGLDFQRLMIKLAAPGIPLVPLHGVPAQGGFWLDSPARIHGLMERWTREAAADVFTGEADGALAELMLWVLPDRDETRAAVWYTRATEAEKARHLAWYARLARDAGKPISEDALERRFQQISEQFQTHIRRQLQRLGREPPRRSPLFHARAARV